MLDSKKFGQKITFVQATDYFTRYVEMKKKHGAALRGHLQNDPDAQRFFCGRQGQLSENEDWAYVFDPESLKRLLDEINATGADSLIIYQGIRNLTVGDDPSESNGRPTILVFPAKFDASKADGEFILGKNGEEHPGTGGGVGGPAPLTMPQTISVSRIHTVI